MNDSVHGMVGKKNAAKDGGMISALPRVRCSEDFKVAAVAQAKKHKLSWSAYVRFLIDNDRELQKNC